MKRVAGFTLVELLISMSLLSMIIMVGSSAFGLFGKKWGGQLGNFDLKVQSARNMMLVQDTLDSLVPYVVTGERGKPIIYFEGNRNGFVAVSSRSLFSHGSLSVVRFSVKQNPDLTYHVLFEESPMTQAPLVAIDQELEFLKPITLFKAVQSPRFEYYGEVEPSGKEYIDEFEEISRQGWMTDYSAVRSSNAPAKARITFDTADGRFQIYSVLATAKPGLLSGYRGSRTKKSGDGLESSTDENCYC